MSRLRTSIGLLVLATLQACAGGGINAGGESPTNNGGVAFIALAGMLILACVILWIILGRED